MLNNVLKGHLVWQQFICSLTFHLCKTQLVDRERAARFLMRADIDRPRQTKREKEKVKINPNVLVLVA